MTDMITAYEVFRCRFRMQSDDSKPGRNATTVLSTVELPDLIDFDQNMRYETCVFRGSGSTQILRRYSSQGDAVEGHRIMEARMGLKPVSKLVRA